MTCRSWKPPRAPSAAAWHSRRRRLQAICGGWQDPEGHDAGEEVEASDPKPRFQANLVCGLLAAP